MMAAGVPARPARALLAVWVTVAALNLGSGLAISAIPSRQTDLDTVARWGQRWLVDGTDIYSAWDEYPDYPPHAIVLLSPLSLVAPAVRVPLWAALNVLLAIAAVSVALRTYPQEAGPGGTRLRMAMLLCWGGFRTLLQFSLMALTCGLAAVLQARRRPVLSGICLGLSLMKPQIAAPFVLWAIFARRWLVLATATLTVITGSMVYCVRAQALPTDVVGHYAGILSVFYAGDAALAGLAQLRPLIAAVTADNAFADAAAGTIACGVLAVICWFGWMESREGRRPLFSAPPLVAIWSLLTFYHLTYGFVLLLPLATLLLAGVEDGTRVLRSRIFWALQVLLMFDVPGLTSRLVRVVAVPEQVSAILYEADRLLAVALLIAVARLALKIRRLERARPGSRADEALAMQPV